MAQQPGYPPQGYDQPRNSYGDTSPQPEGQTQPAASTGRKKRQYAGQAYDFGAGANTQPPAGGSFSGPGPAAYDGYGAQAQPGYPQPGYGAEYQAQAQEQPAYGQPSYGQPAYAQPAPAVGGYQAPDVGYPGPAPQGGVSAITQGISNMGFGGSPQPPPQQAGLQRPHLNQLYPTDMLNQPFQVSELDLPPPSIVLPPNVSTSSYPTS